MLFLGKGRFGGMEGWRYGGMKKVWRYGGMEGKDGARGGKRACFYP